MNAAIDFWRSPAGLDCITPRGKRWPEGVGFPAFLRAQAGLGSVLEFGCGDGRLAPIFAAGRYTGVDVSAHAVDAARQANRGYRFETIAPEQQLPEAAVTFAHTVLLHVPDDELAAVIARFESPRVIVSEILGRHWRREGNPPVFNRDRSDYEFYFAPRYRLRASHAWPYPHYPDTDLTLLEFVRC